ncbi:YciI family protein [Gammaproteobacteria bacterium]|nr:YciI family protein [Gammaproteobacteria bacterium]MDG1953107.1 YciI family protein [Gammaproteobacteria bacterium]MDG2117686.1 YciI family protein [Gammaproteobacteria bacterium]|tara:strand:+ start:5822 stop:6106 length:285 start_codon:yes stop_codon:yes gene_type:complete
MQFLITAYDGKDDKALDRRLAARDSHLARGKTFSDLGNILKGGAIISDAGAMIGSALLVEFDSREEVDKWLEEDPYVAGNVWNEITVVQVKLAF